MSVKTAACLRVRAKGMRRSWAAGGTRKRSGVGLRGEMDRVSIKDATGVTEIHRKHTGLYNEHRQSVSRGKGKSWRGGECLWAQHLGSRDEGPGVQGI